jgi:uncharacterized protein (TIGR02594 family)
MSEPVWLAEARKWIGQREVPGKQHNPWIVRMCIALGLPWRDDETPWCGTFMGWVMKQCGIEPPKTPARARSWATWGVKIDKPVPGCVVAFWRGSPTSGNGHVGLVTRTTADGYLVVLGANQKDMVREDAFGKERVLSYRWPLGVPVPGEGLKTTSWRIPVSTNEA